MNLLQRDGDTAMPASMACTDRGDGPARRAPHRLGGRTQCTAASSSEQHRPTRLIDQLGDHHGQTRGRAADLNRRPTDRPGEQCRLRRRSHRRLSGPGGDRVPSEVAAQQRRTTSDAGREHRARNSASIHCDRDAGASVQLLTAVLMC